MMFKLIDYYGLKVFVTKPSVHNILDMVLLFLSLGMYYYGYFTLLTTVVGIVIFSSLMFLSMEYESAVERVEDKIDDDFDMY